MIHAVGLLLAAGRGRRFMASHDAAATSDESSVSDASPSPDASLSPDGAAAGSALDREARPGKLDSQIDGVPVALRAATSLLDVCPVVVAVVRPDQSALATGLQRAGCLICHTNPQWPEGMGATLAAGASYLLHRYGADPDLRVVVLPADMPAVRAETVRALVHASSGRRSPSPESPRPGRAGSRTPESQPSVRPSPSPSPASGEPVPSGRHSGGRHSTPRGPRERDDAARRAGETGDATVWMPVLAPCDGEAAVQIAGDAAQARPPGHPVVFDGRHLPALASLRDDRGARAIRESSVCEPVPVPDDGIYLDIDSIDDLRAFGQRLRDHGRPVPDGQARQAADRRAD